MKIRRAIITLTILLALLMPGYARADDRLDSIEIEVYLHQDGSASIVETWRTEVSSGTENYKPFGNLQDAVISDFVVIANGKEYEAVAEWDSAWTREQKAGKSAILQTSHGVELCWGIDKYTYYIYELQYNVSNFVQQYDDYLGIYWQFVSSQMNPLPQSVTVRLHSENGFTDKAIRIWAFGFSGGWKIMNGPIVATTNKPISGSDFVELMLRLPLGYLESSSRRPQSFAEAMSVYSPTVSAELALEGNAMRPTPPATTENPDRKPQGGLFYTVFGGNISAVILSLFAVMLGFVGLAVVFKSIMGLQYASARKEVSYEEGFLPGDDIFSDYQLLIMAKVCAIQSLIQTLFVRWSIEGYLQAENDPEDSSPSAASLRINRILASQNEVENQLFGMLVEAAGERSEISYKEYIDWLRQNSPRLYRWSLTAEDYAEKHAMETGYIRRVGIGSFSILRLTALGKERLTRLLSFREYFDRYLNEAMQGELNWQDLSLYSTLFDVRDFHEDNFRILFELRGDLLLFNRMWNSWTILGTAGLDINRFATAAMLWMSNVKGAGSVEFAEAASGGISSGGGGGMGAASGGGRR